MSPRLDSFYIFFTFESVLNLSNDCSMFFYRLKLPFSCESSQQKDKNEALDLFEIISYLQSFVFVITSPEPLIELNLLYKETFLLYFSFQLSLAFKIIEFWLIHQKLISCIDLFGIKKLHFSVYQTAALDGGWEINKIFSSSFSFS